MNEESNSKQTFKITLTCQSAAQLTSQAGALKETLNRMFQDLPTRYRNMRLAFGALHVTQTVVEEVSPSQKLPTKKP